MAASHEACLPEPALLPEFARLINGKLIFNYRNGDDWFDVHPLLWDELGST